MECTFSSESVGVNLIKVIKTRKGTDFRRQLTAASFKVSGISTERKGKIIKLQNFQYLCTWLMKAACKNFPCALPAYFHFCFDPLPRRLSPPRGPHINSSQSCDTSS